MKITLNVLKKIVDINDLKERCVINIKNISNEDFKLILAKNKSLNDYIYEYQQEFINNNYAINLYLNIKYNFSMTLFKYSECSIFLIENGYQQISTNNLIGNLSKSLNSNLLYIQSFIKFQNKITFSYMTQKL